MSDLRVRNLARLLVNYCIEAKPRQTVGVSSGTEAEPLVVEVYRELIDAGAYPVLRVSPESVTEIFYRHGKKHHFSSIPPFAKAYARSIDASISIYSATNTTALSGVDPAKQAALARTMRPVSDIMTRKRWVITLFPTNAYAQNAEMGLEEFENFVYAATFADRKDPVKAWRELGRKQQKLADHLRGADEIRLIGPGTDLKLSVKGRKFVNSDGRRNMPSGEIFAAPIENSAEGTIEFDYPVCRDGREIEGVKLTFRGGLVVEASARKNEKFLISMLDTDAGARRLGELGIGTNYGIDRFIKSILFDEKIGGTVHLAVGRSPQETGGVNGSAIHWDMIKDLRRGGSILVDGKPFQKNGRFVGCPGVRGL